MVELLASIAIVVMRFFPDTVVGRFLRRYLVDKPMRLIDPLERIDLIRMVVVCVVLLAAGDLAAIFMPELIMSATSISLMIDGALVSVTLAAVASVRAVPRVVRARLIAARQRRAARPRFTPRERRRHRPSKPHNDDEQRRIPRAA